MIRLLGVVSISKRQFSFPAYCPLYDGDDIVPPIVLYLKSQTEIDRGPYIFYILSSLKRFELKNMKQS